MDGRFRSPHPRPLSAGGARGALALLLPLLLAGCGGHGGRPSSPAAKGGRAVLKVEWPDRKARLIPSAANSLVVTLAKADGTPVATQTIPRPAAGTSTTSTEFSALPYGDLRVAVAAYPNDDGTGVAQASGADTLRVEEDKPGAVDVALGSTVKTLSVTPASAYVSVGGTATLTATAKDASGALVLLAAGGGSDVYWVSYEPRVATLTGNGPTATLKGLTTGRATVYARVRLDDDGGTLEASGSLLTLPDTMSVSLPSEMVYGTTAATFTAQGTTTDPGVSALSLAAVPFRVNLSPAADGLLYIDSSTTGPIGLATSYWMPKTVLFVYPGDNPAYMTHVDADTPATVTVTMGPMTATGTTTVKPDPLVSVSGPASVKGGASATGTVALGLNALQDETVVLSCDDPGVALPATVVVAPTVVSSGGHQGGYQVNYTFRNSAPFTFTAPPVTSPRDVTITATRAGVSKTYTFTITP